jgi:hypothetical protein
MTRGMMKLVWGERADLFLDSHRTVPQGALSTGFQFRFPTLSEALSDLLGPHPIPIAQLMQEASTDPPRGLKPDGCSRPAGDGVRGGADTSQSGSAFRDGGLPAEPF